MSYTQPPLVREISRPTSYVEEAPSGYHEGLRQHPLSAPALVLLAAGAIYAGYQWLDLLPKESPFIVELLIVGSLPVAIRLTRHVSGRGGRILRSGFMGCGVLSVVLALLVLAVGGSPWCPMLGAASLALAVSLLLLVSVGERQKRLSSRIR